MKAIVFEDANKYSFKKDYPEPQVEKGDILLKVRACGFCGTDYKVFTYGHRAVTPPRVIGHEIVGEVDTIGKDVKTDLKKGDRVIVVTPIGCGKCLFCRQGKMNMCSLVANEVHSIGYYTDGGFAEYCLIPAEAVKQNVLIKIPKSVSDEQAAVVEPLSCVINGQEKVKVQPEDIVLIIGAGPIGVLHALVAQAQGAKNIIMIDIAEEKLSMAQKVVPSVKFVNTRGIDAKEKILELTDQAGADVVIVAAPSTEAQQLAVSVAAIMGRISFFAGLPKGTSGTYIETNIIHYKELEVYGSFASYHAQYKRALDLIETKQIDVSNLITHTIPLKDIKKAVALFQSGKTLKSVIIV